MTARSKLPQKKCTGLTLPVKPDRNSDSAQFAASSCRQNAVAWSGTYSRGSTSSAKGIAGSTSLGTGRIRASRPTSARSSIVSA